MTNVPLADPPTNLLDADGVRNFVKCLHQAHVRDGLPAVATAYLAVKRHPVTGETFQTAKLLRVDDDTQLGSVEIFTNSVRSVAERSRALACVSVMPVAIADGLKGVRPQALSELVLAYVVEHVNPSLCGKCWTASLILEDDKDQVCIVDDLKEYERPALVSGALSNLLPIRSMN